MIRGSGPACNRPARAFSGDWPRATHRKCGAFRRRLIHRVVRRELRRALIVASQKIQPDASLPEDGRRTRDEHDEPIEPGDRFSDPPGAEVGLGAVNERLRRLAGRDGRREDERRANDELQHGRSHDKGPDCRTGCAHADSGNQ
jgi:hypothetical protein